MLLPNKFISLENSIMGKMPCVLRVLNEGMTVSQLYDVCHKNFPDVAEFIMALDMLYVLDKISVDYDTGVVSHVN